MSFDLFLFLNMHGLDDGIHLEFKGPLSTVWSTVVVVMPPIQPALP